MESTLISKLGQIEWILKLWFLYEVWLAIRKVFFCGNKYWWNILGVIYAIIFNVGDIDRNSI